jgi:ABC-2 type transport system permease protein
LLGFHSQGSLCLAIFVGVLTSFSIIGVGLIIACLARTVSEAFIYANFPLIFLMFFTGAAFPIPTVPLFAVGSRTIGLFDVLPPTHAVVALNKVLTLGAGFGEILYEVAALTSLSLLYFGIGVWLFQRTRLHKSS